MANDPYAHAPRLPEGPVDPRELFHPPTAGVGPAPVADPAAPVELEIGPGRGWFTFERIDADPQVRVVGLEVKRKWATIVDERLAKRGYGHRGRVFAEDVKQALPRFATASVAKAYLHFPDPWWKKRHEKRLVLGPDLLVVLSRVLIPGGELLIQTDVESRGEQYEAVVAGCSAFEAWETSPRVEDHPHVARSPRERKAMEDGLPIVRLRYRCRGPVDSAV
ncbi:MAG TPA: tRNA (guanine-N7)-methyltransferase [Polyangiaceae bacterium]|nr:tRNA (guanine-N7)-methyltransferase [Polyangiaceae bacterium]